MKSGLYLMVVADLPRRDLGTLKSLSLARNTIVAAGSSVPTYEPMCKLMRRNVITYTILSSTPDGLQRQ